MPERFPGPVGFVFGGGGVLGAVEVGMARALLHAGIRPDLVVGTSIGAFNGAAVAASPDERVAERLIELWVSPEARTVYGDSLPRQLGRFARRTHLHSPAPLRRLLTRELGEDTTFDDLPVPFQCCAASIERAAEHWFDKGPLVEAVLASSAVPGLLPPVHLGEEHFIDGGIVNSVPVGRAVTLGARTVFVMQVGRIERPLRPPRRPWRSRRSRSKSPGGTASPGSCPRRRPRSPSTSYPPAAAPHATTHRCPTAT